MPVDDPVLSKVTYPQWLWYAAQFAADDKDQFELLRDIAEHNASFWNPEAVDQVRRAREKTFVVSDKNFAKQLEETFGRKLQIPERKSNQGLPEVPAAPAAQSVRRRMRADVDPRAYLDTELDEVKFVPKGA